MNDAMVFVYIPPGKYPNTRAQLARDSGKKAVMNMKLPVIYPDEDSQSVFTDLAQVTLYARSKRKVPRFVEPKGR
jgi:hypothetical protein